MKRDERENREGVNITESIAHEDSTGQSDALTVETGRMKKGKDVLRTMPLKAGVRVRVSKSADSPLAGRQGVVMYVGDGVCDVKVVEHKGKQRGEVLIDTLPKSALLSLRPNVELVSLRAGDEAGALWARRILWGLGAIAALTLIALGVAHGMHIH